MMKKKVIVTLSVVLALSLISVSAYFIGEKSKLDEYKNSPLNLSPSFTVTAHTGCEGTKENSMEYLEKAIETGSEILEFDIRFDENGEPVLSHDLPMGNEVTLKEAFAFISKYPNVKVNVDIKETAYLEKIEEYAQQYHVLEQIFFTGVSDDFLSDVRTKTKNIAYYLNVNVDKKKAADNEYLKELCRKVEESGAIGINFNYKNATKELVECFHSYGLSVSIWTVDNEKDMYKILTFSPDNITTRNPIKLKEIINSKNN